MSKPLTLDDLVATEGVVGAVTWQEPLPGTSKVHPPQVKKFAGFKKEERAYRLMMTAEALVSAVSAIVHLSLEHRPEFRTTELPVDSIIIHGQNFSLIAGFDNVAAIIDNSVSVDFRELSRKIALVQED